MRRPSGNVGLEVPGTGLRVPSSPPRAAPFPKALRGAGAPSARPLVWPHLGRPALGCVVKGRMALAYSREPPLRGTGWEEGH